MTDVRELPNYEIKRYTLRFVNRFRKNMGMSPLESLPRGHFQNSRSCPIAKSLGPGVAVLPEEVELYPKKNTKMSISRACKMAHALEKAGGKIQCGELDGLSFGDYVAVDLPEYVVEFLTRFDDEVFPDLIIRR